MKFEGWFEVITEEKYLVNYHILTKVCKVIGGWLVKVTEHSGIAITFLSDPKHRMKWK